jgi:hypothetical protein
MHTFAVADFAGHERRSHEVTRALPRKPRSRLSSLCPTRLQCRLCQPSQIPSRCPLELVQSPSSRQGATGPATTSFLSSLALSTIAHVANLVPVIPIAARQWRIEAAIQARTYKLFLLWSLREELIQATKLKRCCVQLVARPHDRFQIAAPFHMTGISFGVIRRSNSSLAVWWHADMWGRVFLDIRPDLSARTVGQSPFSFSLSEAEKQPQAWRLVGKAV